MAAAGVIDPLTLPPDLEASEPPEARGLRRDEVRLLVSAVSGNGVDTISHARFNELDRWLAPGDLLVVNTSGTLNAALEATVRVGSGALQPGDRRELHLSTAVPGGFWTVAVRRFSGKATLPDHGVRAGAVFDLPDDAEARLLAPYPLAGSMDAGSRLWIAALTVPDPIHSYLDRFGAPIRYGYVPEPWPSSMYQTIFATEPGSAEMPSAGRPFSADLVTRLVSHGVQVAPLLLHTGVASLEDHEPPYEEYYAVPPETAERVNAARRAGHRIVAVGTTVVRALETVTDTRGVTSGGRGWTDLVITPERPLRAVTGIITGLHEPHATHLSILERVVAAAGDQRRGRATGGNVCAPCILARAYAAARSEGYLWHEFGDSHLIVASSS